MGAREREREKEMLNQQCLVNAITFRFRRVHFCREKKAPFARSRSRACRAKQKVAWENATSGGIKAKVAVVPRCSALFSVVPHFRVFTRIKDAIYVFTGMHVVRVIRTFRIVNG